MFRRPAVVPALLAPLALCALLAGCATDTTPREVNVAVTENGFEPDSVSLDQGRQAVLIITRKTDATCATEAIFQETGRKYELPLNEAVRISIPTDQRTTLHYACSMDMYHGKIIVR